MNQQDSTLIRISRELKADLEELGRLWRSEWYKGRMNVPPPNDRDSIPMERIIRELLDRDVAHRERARKNSKRETAPESPGVQDSPTAD